MAKAPLYVQVRPDDNVAIVVDDAGLRPAQNSPAA